MALIDDNLLFITIEDIKTSQLWNSIYDSKSSTYNDNLLYNAILRASLFLDRLAGGTISEKISNPEKFPWKKKNSNDVITYENWKKYINAATAILVMNWFIPKGVNDLVGSASFSQGGVAMSQTNDPTAEDIIIKDVYHNLRLAGEYLDVTSSSTPTRPHNYRPIKYQTDCDDDYYPVTKKQVRHMIRDAIKEKNFINDSTSLKWKMQDISTHLGVQDSDRTYWIGTVKVNSPLFINENGVNFDFSSINKLIKGLENIVNGLIPKIEKNTNKINDIPNQFVSLLKGIIDNDTIYFDENNKLKAKQSSGSSVDVLSPLYIDDNGKIGLNYNDGHFKIITNNQKEVLTLSLDYDTFANLKDPDRPDKTMLTVFPNPNWIITGDTLLFEKDKASATYRMRVNPNLKGIESIENVESDIPEERKGVTIKAPILLGIDIRAGLDEDQSYWRVDRYSGQQQLWNNYDNKFKRFQDYPQNNGDIYYLGKDGSELFKISYTDNKLYYNGKEIVTDTTKK